MLHEDGEVVYFENDKVSRGGWPAGGGGVGEVRAEVCSQPTDACCMGGGACVGQLCCSVTMCDLPPPPPLAAVQAVWNL